MKRMICALAWVALLGAQETSPLKAVKAKDVKWSAAPGLSPGVMTALQWGDPEKGPYQVLIKFPAGAQVAPHYHKVDEFATVASGKVVFGSGDTIDDARGVEVGAGGYVLIPAGTAHWAKCKEEAIIVRFGNGPRELTPCSPDQPAPNKTGAAKVTPAKDVPWEDAPGMPAGVKTALQYGDPAKGPYIILLKFPAGFTNAPHFHSADEIVTILSGVAVTGEGRAIDASRGLEVGPGGYYVIPAKTPHWATFKSELVLTRLGNGPRDITYVDRK
jgi:quercetin dioxygenase-like cupin family protein